jgi:CheY-like chemotaxis protein
MSEHLCIFLVDGNPEHRQVIRDHLQDPQYQIHPFATGEECLAALDLQPDMILLDLELAGRNGLDVCREIRAFDDKSQVIFLTDSDVPNVLVPDILLKTYQVGGNDFIHKYPNKDLLLRKINHAVNNLNQTAQLQKQLNYAEQTAHMVMTNLGELGSVLLYMRELNACRNEPEVGQLLLQTLSQFNLKGLIKLDDGRSGEYYFCSETNCSPLEFSILGYVSKKNRISLSAERMALNYPHITMLAMGLDTNDPDGIGRLRDHLAMLAEGAGIKINALINERLSLQQANSRLEDAKELTTLLTEIEKNQCLSQQAMETCSEHFQAEMENAFMFLGLTDSQELRLNGILENYRNNLKAQLQNDSELAKKLSSLVDRQRSLLSH